LIIYFIIIKKFILLIPDATNRQPIILKVEEAENNRIVETQRAVISVTGIELRPRRRPEVTVLTNAVVITIEVTAATG